MSNKKILERIEKQAQEAAIAEPEIDQATADKMAQDIFDKVFDEELAKLISSVS